MHVAWCLTLPQVADCILALHAWSLAASPRAAAAALPSLRGSGSWGGGGPAAPAPSPRIPFAAPPAPQLRQPPSPREFSFTPHATSAVAAVWPMPHSLISCWAW